MSGVVTKSSAPLTNMHVGRNRAPLVGLHWGQFRAAFGPVVGTVLNGFFPCADWEPVYPMQIGIDMVRLYTFSWWWEAGNWRPRSGGICFSV